MVCNLSAVQDGMAPCDWFIRDCECLRETELSHSILECYLIFCLLGQINSVGSMLPFCFSEQHCRVHCLDVWKWLQKHKYAPYYKLDSLTTLFSSDKKKGSSLHFALDLPILCWIVGCCSSIHGQFIRYNFPAWRLSKHLEGSVLLHKGAASSFKIRSF